MSNTPLPKKIDPRKLADRGVRIQGDAELALLPNLATMLAGEQGQVSVDLQFDTDELRIRTIKGTADAKVFMTCQRCLEPVEIEVEAKFNLAVAPTEEHAKNLPRYYDPLIVAGDDLELLPMVEEELILSLPIVPYHDDCSVQTSFGDEVTTDNKTDKPNPFSVLASLKADK
ncbi:YceD family protein [Amphritea sp. 1_MG-2023]|uniref:YceD family protein n=1 Tax=Amphritea sp. 1_MG-2023 TaxID=3062670 RepID=UPI0026E11913|nr:YceD family protein [Amphritea sp. 1_MG-2023]MDO6563110.1 YceD family protein [Amphritea sp. 1_MG-2023]